MQVLRHEDSPWQDWRPGVKTRVWSAAITGAKSAHMGEQIMEPGTGAPYHWHYYEEHLTIYSGTAEVRVDDEVAIVEGPATVVFPAQARHGFTNVGDTPLHIIGAVPYPIHETMIADDPKGTFTVGWEPGEDYRRRRLTEEGPPK